jgi:hypothetical protein
MMQSTAGPGKRNRSIAAVAKVRSVVHSGVGVRYRPSLR